MINLKQLKTRLEKLPHIKAEYDLLGYFGDYSKKLAKASENVLQARTCMKYITKVYPDSECETKVFPLLQKGVKEARHLHNDIMADPQKVKTRTTENRIVALGEYSIRASNQCLDIWKTKITESVAKWEKIAIVVQNLGAKGGKEFKQAVD